MDVHVKWCKIQLKRGTHAFYNQLIDGWSSFDPDEDENIRLIL